MIGRDQYSTQHLHINIFIFYPSRVNESSRERSVSTFLEPSNAMIWYIFVNIQRVTNRSMVNRREIFTIGEVVLIGAILVAGHYFASRWSIYLYPVRDVMSLRLRVGQIQLSYPLCHYLYLLNVSLLSNVTCPWKFRLVCHWIVSDVGDSFDKLWGR